MFIHPTSSARSKPLVRAVNGKGWRAILFRCVNEGEGGGRAALCATGADHCCICVSFAAFAFLFRCGCEHVALLSQRSPFASFMGCGQGGGRRPRKQSEEAKARHEGGELAPGKSKQGAVAQGMLVMSIEWLQAAAACCSFSSRSRGSFAARGSLQKHPAANLSMPSIAMSSLHR